MGNALMVALKRDLNGACYGVFPDCPLMDIPNSNTAIFFAYAVLGQYVGQKFGLEVITPFHLTVVAILALMLFIFLGRLFGFI